MFELGNRQHRVGYSREYQFFSYEQWGSSNAFHGSSAKHKWNNFNARVIARQQKARFLDEIRCQWSEIWNMEKERAYRVIKISANHVENIVGVLYAGFPYGKSN